MNQTSKYKTFPLAQMEIVVQSQGSTIFSQAEPRNQIHKIYQLWESDFYPASPMFNVMFDWWRWRRHAKNVEKKWLIKGDPHEMAKEHFMHMLQNSNGKNHMII